MATQTDYQRLLDQFGALQEKIVEELGAALIERPELADALVQRLDAQRERIASSERTAPAPRDLGLSQLAGVGPEAAKEFGEVRVPYGAPVYDETVTSERITAIGDLYYLYQHEKIGIFRVIRKLQQLFRTGSVRLSSGSGAYGLYRFDRREVLRYTRRDRLAAYRRSFGYGSSPIDPGARANTDFHPMFVLFNEHVANYWRDKRISDVIRERAHDPSYGSVAMVRRAGLDLRNNLKFVSYGNINVLRVEVMQLLEEAFKILEADDVKRLFGADNGWDVAEEVLTRYFNVQLTTSPRQRMAVAGRNIFRWLAQPHVMETARPQFEALLMDIDDDCEEWLTSAQAIGVARWRNGTSARPIDGRLATARQSSQHAD
jgi:hypothetical protein